MIADFEITMTGIKDSPHKLLLYATTQLQAVNVLLTMNVSDKELMEYSERKLVLEQKIKELELEIKENRYPSQVSLI